VDDLLDVGDGFLEHAQRRGVGQHQAGGVRADCRLQRCKIDAAGRVGGDLLDRVAAHGRGRRVGAVRRVRHDDFAAGAVAPRVVVGADHRHSGELSMRPRHRRHRHAGHAGDVLQHLLQLEHAGEEALAGFVRAGRMACQELRQHRQRIACPRVVFHGARTERVELRVDREILLRKPRVVAHHVELGDFRQSRRVLAPQLGWQVVEAAASGRQLGGSGAAGTGMVEYQHGVEIHLPRIPRGHKGREGTRRGNPSSALPGAPLRPWRLIVLYFKAASAAS
jgi:hypothetical protein